MWRSAGRNGKPIRRPYQARCERELGYPMFAKPANLGSSVGISKIHGPAEFAPALDRAARYDRRLLIEQGLDAREIECSVLGNDHPIASVCGEIVPRREFYDFRAKYLDENSDLIIPADLPEAVSERGAAVGRGRLPGDRRGGHGAGGLLRHAQHDSRST